MYSVYMHTCPSGKKYIGITSKTPQERWKNGYRNNKHFSNAIKQYGWENIKHEVLFRGLTKEDAEQKEIELISLYDTTNQSKGYNIALGGHSNSGYHHKAETKQKIRESLTGAKHTAERIAKNSKAKKNQWQKSDYRRRMSEAHKGKSKGKNNPTARQVCQYDMQGNFIRVFDCITDAEKALGIDHRQISDCCRKKQKSSHGYIWKYA